MNKAEWKAKLLALPITTIDPVEANQVLIDFWRWACDVDDNIDDLMHVLWQLTEVSNKLVPEDD